MMRKLLILILLLCCGACFAAPKDVVDKADKCVVFIEAVVKMTMSMDSETDSEEEEIFATGVVTDSEGTVVTSATVMDPTLALQSLFGGVLGSLMKFDISYKSVKVRFPNGERADAEIVSTDKDTDTAVLRVKSLPSGVVPAEKGGTLDLFDDFIVCARARRGDNSLAAWTCTVGAVLSKPRKMYYCKELDMGGKSTPGNPVFTLDGKLVGFVTTYINPDLRMDNIRTESMGMTAVNPL